MNRDPFYYHLEELDDDLIQESADAKRNRWKTLLLAVGVIALVIVLVNLVLAIPAHEDAQNLGGEKGVLCDGVYYIYAGSGFAPPGEVRVPRGIFAYTPGREPELLVSVEDYSLDTIFPSWDVSAQGLFFIDQNQNTLWRMDLETREVTLLYDMPEEEAPEGDVGLGDIVTYYGNGESSPAMEYNPYLFLDGLWEDHIALIANTGWETYDLVLDCRTGEVLSQKIRSQSEGWNRLAGDRLLKEYRMDYPEGTEYPGWEFDKKGRALPLHRPAGERRVRAPGGDEGLRPGDRGRRSGGLSAAGSVRRPAGASAAGGREERGPGSGRGRRAR